MTALERLARLEVLEKAATAGDWIVCTNPGGPDDQPAFPYIEEASKLPHGEGIIAMPTGFSETVKANARFIAESRNALPGLIAALREAVTALEEIREFKAWPSSNSLSQSALATIETLLKP